MVSFAALGLIAGQPLLRFVKKHGPAGEGSGQFLTFIGE
jgi:hypothetical protein